MPAEHGVKGPVEEKEQQKKKQKKNDFALYVDIYRCSVLIVLILSVSGIGGLICFVFRFCSFFCLFSFLIIIIFFLSLLSNGLQTGLR